mgnify:CR=1 FL=1
MKHRKGCLVQRNGRFYCRVKIDGRVIVRALHNPDGTTPETHQEARKAQAIATREFALLDRKQALESAIRKLADVDAQLDAIQNPKVKLSDCWQAYQRSGERPDSGPYTLANYKRHTRDFVTWAQKRYPRIVYLCDVPKAMASDYSRHLTDTFSNTTHNKNISFLRLLFKTLVEGQHNPFERIRLKPKDTTPHQALTQAQLQSILAKAEGELNTFLLVGIYTSLRRKDACLLKWDSIDMEKGLITVMPSKTATRSHKVVSIPIHPVLKGRLSTLFRSSEYVMPRMAFWYDHNPAHISRRIRDLFESAGIKTRLEIDNKKGTRRNNKSLFSFHSLRFTMGQQLIDAGYTLDAIAQVLGHTNTAMSRHYSTVSDTVKEKAILSLPSITATATA